MKKEAAANLTPVRQRTQYTCMATSLMMCLNAQGRDFDEDTVNRVMGAQPMQGASWEAAMNAAQHFGFRIHMVVPATVKMLKEWTDQGIPVMIAWNPEGRPWSHASVVFDVKDDGTVLVADPNIPDPDETVRTVSKDDFYHKWFEKAPDYLVRRPAMAIMPEITSDGRQVVAKASVPVQNKKPKDNKIIVPGSKPRSDAAKALKERGGTGGGIHQNREKDFEKGQTRKPKHKTDWRDKDASSVLALNIDRTGNIRITDWHTQEDLTSRLGHFFHALGYPADQKGSFQDWVKRFYKSELNSDGSRTYGPFIGIQLVALAEKFERTHRIASEADRLTDRYMEKTNV